MQDIVGARSHCAICPSVDICSQCEAAGLPGNLTTTEDNGHESSHIMIKIPFPLQHDEVRTASRRAMHLWAGRDAPAIGKAAMMNDDLMGLEKKAMLSDYDGTVLGDKKGRNSMNGSTQGAYPFDHRIQCNACGRNIVGVRYQCAGCPALPGNVYSLVRERLGIDDLSLTINPVRGMRCEELYVARSDSQLLQNHNPSRPSNLLGGGSCAATVCHNLRLLSRHAYINSSSYIMHAGQSLDGSVNNNEDPRGLFSLDVNAI